MLSDAISSPPRIVAALRHSAVFAGEHEAVGTVVQFGLAVDALPVSVAVCAVAHHTSLQLAWIFLLSLLAMA